MLIGLGFGFVLLDQVALGLLPGFGRGESSALVAASDALAGLHRFADHPGRRRGLEALLPKFCAVLALALLAQQVGDGAVRTSSSWVRRSPRPARPAHQLVDQPRQTRAATSA
jgi:hypothetical protein